MPEVIKQDTGVPVPVLFVENLIKIFLFFFSSRKKTIFTEVCPFTSLLDWLLLIISTYQ